MNAQTKLEDLYKQRASIDQELAELEEKRKGKFPTTNTRPVVDQDSPEAKEAGNNYAEFKERALALKAEQTMVNEQIKSIEDMRTSSVNSYPDGSQTGGARKNRRRKNRRTKNKSKKNRRTKRRSTR